eukprot:CAMPEP_0178900222 /NCGR_PEP_ID=MMETSP0786-20121207/3354_1 /TAXON_ID=186022 /ORGANISM="Thalassionema frauenfeldii, Strain CCMP 1798" /LENGTH=344 /DNA_ID=CAMNT_0020571203 /DNA_START=2579 /DNA_END=3613 /DNA_ORIENTATION=+
MGRFPTSRNSGRGRGRSNTSRKKPSDKSSKEYRFYPSGMGKYKATFNDIKDKVEMDVQQTFGKRSGDVVQSLRDMKKMDYDKLPPKLKVSTKTKDDEKERENRQFELDYTEDRREHEKRKELYDSNMAKAYARIWEKYTSEPMKNRIRNLSDYETKVRDDPIELLTRVREIMLMPKKSRYHYDSMTEAILSFLLCKQTKHESLRDYYSKFKQARDNLKEDIGDDFIRHFVKQTKEYKDETDKRVKSDLEKNGFKHWTAYILIRNADDSKYGSLKQELKGRYGGKFDEYPRSVEAAYDRLLQHKWDATFEQKKKKPTDKHDKDKSMTEEQVNMNQKKKKKHGDLF